jgi:Family of unknown function (DUF6714)
MDDKWAKNYEFHANRLKNNRQKLQSVRDELVKKITTAFADVSRKGGVSLAEVEHLDAGAREQVCKRIRAQQQDKHWSEVDLRLHDPYGIGPSFLDPIGFRYHLPAYMIDQLTIGNCQIDGCELDKWMGQDSILFRLYGTSKSDREYYKLLNQDQRQCVAEFLAFNMELLDDLLDSKGHPYDLYQAIKTVWLPDLPGNIKKHLESIWPSCWK